MDRIRGLARPSVRPSLYFYSTYYTRRSRACNARRLILTIILTSRNFMTSMKHDCRIWQNIRTRPLSKCLRATINADVRQQRIPTSLKTPQQRFANSQKFDCATQQSTKSRTSRLFSIVSYILSQN